MDLPTHFTFGLAVGLVFFGSPEIGLLIALGTLLPDLDREYWFIPKRLYADEQIHRAGLHNVFMMALTYLVNQFLSLGVFLHVLQDSFTTVKDRGVEWFFPITRLVKRGLYDSQGNAMQKDPKEKVYFYQEDPKGLVEKADPDLREYGCDPVPWRRVYGFSQNSQLLDKGFLIGSIIVILIWTFAPGNYLHFTMWTNLPTMSYYQIGIGYAAVGTLFVAGEIDRRNKKPRFGRSKVMKYPIFGLGLALIGIWAIMIWMQMQHNLTIIFHNPVSILMGIIIIPIAIFILLKLKTRGGKTAVF